MWSNAGMASRQGDVDLRFAQVSASVRTLGWLGLGPKKGRFTGAEQRLEPDSGSVAERGRLCTVMWVSPHTHMSFLSLVI